ncbi:MAG: glycosyltransferase family 2 protein [Labilithrix sp.]|nr:glycosyltransferase family 2 protein [Labilithrix sp.]MCW5810837.1 glycosyltransferase family 2 protein [Labilithrix sp.]
MLHERKVYVVVPALDEALHIGRVIATMPRFVDHVFVVDDGSGDGTGQVALSGGDPRVRVLRHDERRGVGAAIATGYAEALREGGDALDAIAVMAGDGQMHPDDLAAVVMPIVRGQADYVKGDRMGAYGVHRKMGLPRWIGGRVFSLLTSLAIREPIRDSQCGYTALARRATEGLDLAGLWPGFGYPNDLLGQLAARAERIREVPVQAIYGDETSKLKLRHLPPFFFIIGRAALRRARSGAARVSPGWMTPEGEPLRPASDVSP